MHKDEILLSKGIVTYSRRQLEFYLLPHYYELQEDIWAFGDLSKLEGRGSRSYHAQYEKACMVAGEIGARIKLIGHRGNMLFDYYSDNCNTEWLRASWGVNDRFDIDIELKRMIQFITGQKRPMTTFKVWLHTRNKHTKPTDYSLFFTANYPDTSEI